MPDRLIRDELLESDRWLGLTTDTARICFVGLLLRCDDFGNLEGGPRRLYRFFSRFAQIKAEADADAVLMQLADADLTRRYERDGREFWHLPRFRPHRNYLVRKYPPSPWDDPVLTARKEGHFLSNQGLAKNIETTLSRGVVGVGVEVGTSKNELPQTAAGDNFLSGDKSSRQKSITWTEHWTSKGKALGINPEKGETSGTYCKRVQTFCKTNS